LWLPPRICSLRLHHFEESAVPARKSHLTSCLENVI
jgi:hypothetical protein